MTIKGYSPTDFFMDSCGGCHGSYRQGGIGPALVPKRLDKERSFYVETIRDGRKKTFMPSWGDKLTPREIDLLVDLIFTEPPPLSSARWGEEEINKNKHILVEDTALVPAPVHSGNLDNLMLVTERDASAFAVIDGDTHTLLGHVHASFRAHGYAFHPLEKRWAYNLGRDGWLFKVDLYQLKAVRSIRLGRDARGLAISDDGKHVIVGNYLPNSAVIVRSDNLEVETVIETSGVNPDGELVESRVAIVSDVSPEKVGPYFIIGLKDAGQVWRIDYSQPDFPIAKLENVGRTLHDGFLSPDNKRFFIASQDDDWMAVVDVESWTLVDTLSTGKKPHPGSGATWSVKDRQYAATVHAGEGRVSIWDLPTGQIVDDVITAGPGLFLRSHHASPYVWADTLGGDPPNEITVFDGQSPGFDVVARIRDGQKTLHPEFTADGAFVYVSDWDEEVVRVYDARFDADSGSFPLVRTISGLKTPTGIFSVARRDETLGH